MGEQRRHSKKINLKWHNQNGDYVTAKMEALL
uniref:Uncharacterized protein n=1 Tax=virus sp. ctHG14 TaxID=2827626 RepID=A0A8S5RIU7_9VIRU|nr:MAG TPA: hypothetical protein [virus sp. ctHG14]DAL86749.1 MAG TPA: hypothetical protein [Bacteriophage sp.]